MEFRPFYMAREWQRLGHEVSIVAATFSHLRQVNPEVSATLSDELVESIRYFWIKTPAYAGNGRGRISNMLRFLAGLYAHRTELIERCRPDVVIASSTYPLDIFPAASIARRTGARLIFEVHDLWPLSPMELGGMSRFHPFIMVMQRGEDYACKHADTIVSMLPKADQHLVTRGMAPSKFVYVPNGAVIEEWNLDGPRLPATHEAVLARYAADGRFAIVYAGAHGLLNNLGLVLDAARELRDTRASFCLVGQGPEREALQRRAAELGLTNVDFLPSVPKASVPLLLDRADALFLSFAPQPLFRFGVSPNKLVDYMLAAKPVIAAMRAGNDPVTENGLGFTVSPEDPHQLADAVRRLVAVSVEERRAMGERGRRTAEEQFAYPPLARRFADCFGPSR
ncbi:MAG: glycosyltransferase family 4 protein [Deltaproteobacteria bacterium]|nr:glycosyltransferase family 4 protein [Deltaproteobacteria bacterium]